MEDKTPHQSTEPLIRSAALGWVVLTAVVLLVLAAGYYLKP